MASRITSPSALITKRSTPWVEGCWGPMLSVISSVRSVDIVVGSSALMPNRLVGLGGVPARSRSACDIYCGLLMLLIKTDYRTFAYSRDTVVLLWFHKILA